MKYQKTMDDDGNSRSAPIILQNIIVILKFITRLKLKIATEQANTQYLINTHCRYLLRDIMTLSITYN